MPELGGHRVGIKINVATWYQPQSRGAQARGHRRHELVQKTRRERVLRPAAVNVQMVEISISPHEGSRTAFLSVKRLWRNYKCLTVAIPTAAGHLVVPATYDEEIPRLRLAMTVATPFPSRGRMAEGIGREVHKGKFERRAIYCG